MRKRLSIMLIIFIVLIACDQKYRYSIETIETNTIIVETKDKHVIAEVLEDTIISDDVTLGYLNVLQNLEKVFFRHDVYLGIDGYSQHALLSEILSLYSKDSDTRYQIDSFAVVDMNSDGLCEVVLEIAPSRDQWILSYEDELVYCYEICPRGMRGLRTDGSFSWSNSGRNWGYGKLEFYMGNCETVILGYMDCYETGEEFYIGDKSVSEDTYFSYINEQDQKEEVEWHIFSEDSFVNDFIKRYEEASKPDAPPEETIAPEATEPAEEPATLPSSGRQPVILFRDPDEPYDENSLFALGFFRDLGDKIPTTLSIVYRTIYPWDEESDVFGEFHEKFNINRRVTSASMADTLVPFLLTDASINMTDEELREKLLVSTDTRIFSKYTENMNYRLIGLNYNDDRVFADWKKWCYVIQAWDDERIWAQPLRDFCSLVFDSAVFITASDGNELLLLNGHTYRPHGSGVARVGTGFVFADDVWTRIQWGDLYEEVTHLESITIKSDGFYMLYYGEPTATAFNLPPFEGALYEIVLEEDGSFWTDYYMYPYDPENDDLPENDLLFRLKQ